MTKHDLLTHSFHGVRRSLDLLFQSWCSRAYLRLRSLSAELVSMMARLCKTQECSPALQLSLRPSFRSSLEATSRLARGDQEGAKNYLAYQSGLTTEEADARVAALRAKADELMVKAREASATVLKTSGWSLFVLIVLSGIASVLGGLLGSQVNVRGTLDSHNEIVTTKRAPIKTLDKPARS